MKIPQYDGQDSCSDSTVSDVSSEHFSLPDDITSEYTEHEDRQNIPVSMNVFFPSDFASPPSWYEPHHKSYRSRKPVRTTLRRDNRLKESIELPIIAVSNLRSLMPKVNNFVRDIHERDIGVALLSEVWEQKSKKKHVFEVDKMLYMEGLKYISTPRPTGKRGGGAAIVAPVEKFNLEKMDILNPHNLEIVWGLMRPKNITSLVKEFIVVAFYCPPNSRKKSKLLDHILTNIHVLITKYPNAGVIIGGDKNELNISSLISGIPRAKQLVTKCTHKNKIIDIILTNLQKFYQVPIIVPPVAPDDPTKGVPSDHSTPLAIPLSDNLHCNTREFKTRTFRPVPDSGIEKFGAWLKTEDWNFLNDEANPSKQVDDMEDTFKKKLDAFLPERTIRTSNDDLPFITAELKYLDRRKKREYRKNGHSEKYSKLLSKFDTKFKKAAESYILKNVTELKNSNPSKAYSILKRMGAPPGDIDDQGSFTLLNHTEDNLTTEESIEQIAQYFAQISQEYPPLDINLLPQEVKDKINGPIDPNDPLPELSDFEVAEQIKKSRKTKSGVPGDLPKVLVENFPSELATPISKIFRNMIKTNIWPANWKTEHGIPLKKVPSPKSEDHLRIISLTSFVSKMFGNFVIKWLLKYVGDLIDRLC